MARPRLLLLVLALASGAARAEETVIGSKAFTESVILGEAARLLITDSGGRATHRKAMGGSAILYAALKRGEIDLYPEYSGTLYHELFAGEALADEGSLRRRLAADGVMMTPPLGFENSYALAMRRRDAVAAGIAAISDLANHPELVIGLSNEFLDRGDGWRVLKAAYRLPQAASGLHHDLSYRGIGDGSLDVIDVYTTDAEIARRDLLVLADDRGFFPRYQAVFLARLDHEAPLSDALAPLTGGIDETLMRRLNGLVLLDGLGESAAAAQLVETVAGRTLALGDEQSRFERIRDRTVEHLLLVAISLAAALLIAVPLSVLVYKRPRLAPMTLAIAGMLQTIPALALFVFMIPLLGIGARPTIAALFLYSLLPILRNGHAGLAGIPAELRDAARALGISPATRLFRIELPLAFPTLLAGIKTAAVINVGAATLGALIGAGGYGQPILTGIRLNNLPLIFEGAIPAAALALLVTGLFDLLGRLLSPRGLRSPAGAARP